MDCRPFQGWVLYTYITPTSIHTEHGCVILPGKSESTVQKSEQSRTSPMGRRSSLGGRRSAAQVRFDAP